MSITAPLNAADSSLAKVVEGLGRPPRLLIVATSYITIRAFLLPFVDHFRSLGWRVDGMAEGIESAEGTRARFDQVYDIKLSRNPFAVANLTSAPSRIQAIVKQGDYDLVHVHTPIASFVARGALRNLRRTGRPSVIYTAHGFHFYKGAPAVKSAFYKLMEKIGGWWTDYLVTINKEDFQAAKSLRLTRPDRVRYMPGIGVDVESLRPETVSTEGVAQLRSELGVPTEARLFLMVANFDPGKRHRELLAAFHEWKGNNSYLVFAGIGPLLETVKSQAATLGIADRCRFLGFRKDVPVLMRASTATILPSEREGLPRSVMESMCLGVPVIGTEIRGLGDLLADECGYTFKVGDVDGLRKQLELVSTDEARRQRVIQNALKRIVSFDVKKVIGEHERLYAEALANVVDT